MKIGQYIVLASLSVLFFIFQNFTTADHIKSYREEETYIHVKDFGAIGNDEIDDTFAIQRAIKYAFENKIQRLIFQKTNYLLNSSHSLNTIVLYGENLSLEGNGATFIKSSLNPGQFGDAFFIGGLIPGAKYPNPGGKIFEYAGDSRPARNIVISDIKIKHTIYSENLKHMNCIGISHVDNLLLKNVTCENAPQTSFAIISHESNTPDLSALKATRITLDGTHSIGSKKHAYRVISYIDNSAAPQEQELDVTIKNCTSTGVQNVEDSFKEIKGHKINLWYRPAYNKAKLTVMNCKFDQSGKVLVSGVKVGSLKLSNNVINGGLFISKGSTKINIEKNKIQCAYPDGSPAIWLMGMRSENTFVNNQLFNYYQGCVKVISSENFEDSPNQVMSRYFETIHPRTELNDLNSVSY